ncbi:MAG: hypothetical protein IPP88_06875 [Betaproteobacteria bacterium]|nr:hypothetical protein [Betaproteobacteria bacterium]
MLEQFESKLAVAYRPVGLFDNTSIIAFAHGGELPTLHSQAPAESAASGYCYLVTLADLTPQIRAVPQRSGGSLYALDQLANPDSIIFQHGGFWNAGVLLYGCVSTVSDSPGALKLQRALSSAIEKYFTRIKSFYVGTNAKSAMASGCRLTIGANSPKEYDLAL